MRSLINRSVLYFLLLFTGFSLFSQEDRVHFSIPDSSMYVAISRIEAVTGYRFYFDSAWISGRSVTAFSTDNLPDALNKVFAGTNINSLILGNKVILTINNPILTELQKESEVPGQFLFEREYRGEKQVSLIGDKRLMIPGKESLIVGYIRDKDTGNPISGAIVYLEGGKKPAISDANGFYTLPATNGKNQLTFSFSGMKPETQNVILFSDGRLDVELEQESIMLEEVSIAANRDANITSVKMGVSTLDLTELKTAPKMLGENDLIQVALTLPGVQNIGEGSSGYNVRGGKTDQNLVQINQATVYNPFHFFGFFSSFNADVMGKTELYKSNIPVEKSGRLSSLLDVYLRPGDKEKFTAQGGINPVTSRLTFEGPIVKGKTSISSGIRSTYSDWILSRVGNENIRHSNPMFFDVANSIHHSYGQNSTLIISNYYSKDRFRLSPDSLYAYVNATGSIEWTHFINQKVALNAVSTISRYKYKIAYEGRPEVSFLYGFDITDEFGQLSMSYFPTDRHEIFAGIDTRYYDVNPGYRKPSINESEVLPVQLDHERGLESSAFISDDFKVNDKVSLNASFRYSVFRSLGGRSISYYAEDQPKSPSTVLETKWYPRNSTINTYRGPEARLGFKYSLSTTSSIKGSMGTSRQYLYALSNNVSVSPTATWKLADPNFSPQRATQFSIGYFKNFKSNAYETSIETYVKRFKNTFDYKTGSDLILNSQLEQDIVSGIGRAMGIELFLKKNTGKLNGWISYTYSISDQRYTSGFLEETINNGEYYPTNFQKPHYLSIVSTYKYTRRYSFSLNVNYSSGRPVTYPTAKYVLGGTEVVHFSERNSYKLPDYFRIDLSLNMEGNHRVKKLAHGFWSFSVYNLTGRDNVYSVFFQNDDGKIQGYQLSVLGNIIPSVTYNFKI